MLNSSQQIQLVFTSFSLQNENNTDALYVYDGKNATEQLLGVFYGGHPPPKKGIQSSSNKMFLIFKSDETDSYTGFKASYNVVGNEQTTCRPSEEDNPRRKGNTHKNSISV